MTRSQRDRAPLVKKTQNPDHVCLSLSAPIPRHSLGPVVPGNVEGKGNFLEVHRFPPGLPILRPTVVWPLLEPPDGTFDSFSRDPGWIGDDQSSGRHQRRSASSLDGGPGYSGRRGLTLPERLGGKRKRHRQASGSVWNILCAFQKERIFFGIDEPTREGF